jgi:hypothetical protein
MIVGGNHGNVVVDGSGVVSKSFSSSAEFESELVRSLCGAVRRAVASSAVCGEPALTSS